MNFNEKLECIFINVQNCPFCQTNLDRENHNKLCYYCYAYNYYKFYISLLTRSLQIYINEIDIIITFSEDSIGLDNLSRNTIFVENPGDYLMVTYPFVKVEKLKTYLLFQ